MLSETQLLKGILEGCILGILAREETYGYKIVELLVRAGFSANEATVYPILLRLQGQGSLRTEKRPSQLGPDRNYYALTPDGQSSYESFQSTWAALKEKVDYVLEVGNHDKQI